MHRKWAIPGTRILIKFYKSRIQLLKGAEMSKKDKSMMPQSSAGLVRYFGQSKEGIKIKPEHVLIACVALIALEIMFKFVG